MAISYWMCSEPKDESCCGHICASRLNRQGVLEMLCKETGL